MSCDILLFPPDSLAIGREALAMAGGDLALACEQQPELKSDIVLAWLSIQIARTPQNALLLVRLAADTLADVEDFVG